MRPRHHNHILAKIRREFDEAKDLGLCEVIFFPQECRLQIGFYKAKTSELAINKICDYVDKKDGTSVKSIIFHDELADATVLELRNCVSLGILDKMWGIRHEP